MKPTDPPENDSGLRQVLREWTLDASLSGDFQAAVWRRVARQQVQANPGVWIVLAQWIETALARPSLATAYVVFLLLLGLTAGYWQAQEKTTRIEHALRAGYVQAIDPYRAGRVLP